MSKHDWPHITEHRFIRIIPAKLRSFSLPLAHENTPLLFCLGQTKARMKVHALSVHLCHFLSRWALERGSNLLRKLLSSTAENCPCRVLCYSVTLWLKIVTIKMDSFKLKCSSHVWLSRAVPPPSHIYGLGGRRVSSFQSFFQATADINHYIWQKKKRK